MPRSPLPRTFFATLPILGALLAAFAGVKEWPLPLSLLAMTVIASACAVIYWSAPLSEEKSGGTQTQNSPAAFLPEVMPAFAAATAQPQDQLSVSPASVTPSLPPAGSIGTRADGSVTGESHETDLLTGLLGAEAFFARLTGKLNRCKAANQTATLVVCDIDAFGEINRTVGMVDANRLLRQVAECFRLTVREGDMLSRLGGDEFGIFFPG
ncbi:MAG TPA: GGDEF domain-containing protein, partial [Acidobacteriaceae bacterium]|nr:GGDEF domain-containing protein [Acidobacteriaceae bacterium]